MTFNQQQNYVQPQTTSAWAIVSLIGGIVSFLFAPMIASIVAVISGYAAKREIRESNGQVGGDGLATAGLIIGWANIVLSLLACVFVVLAMAGVFGSVALCGPLTGWLESISY
ncbi:MAG TPA: DUF4190 domain-containing protein [Anaerolineaceae bacterium]|nr:DUF4190 domain-containing protein [Chloroflexota bacterium]HNY84359.1 DUF4190 domain-containing protein [Anaerolineaceae bacterium]